MATNEYEWYDRLCRYKTRKLRMDVSCNVRFKMGDGPLKGFLIVGILFKHTIELFQLDALTAFNNVNWAVWSKTYVIKLSDKKRTLTAPWHGRLDSQ